MNYKITRLKDYKISAEGRSDKSPLLKEVLPLAGGRGVFPLLEEIKG